MKGKTLIAYLVIVALQVFSLVGMIVYKETTVRTGQEVVLQTVPVDPRDPFRGDFLVLRYVITSLDTHALAWRGPFEQGDTVYVQLERSGEVFDAFAVARSPEPGWDLFIRGRVLRVSGEPPTLEIQYGIESYFVPEGKGLILQRAEDIKAVVVIDGEGRAILQRLLVDGKPFETR
ncbi:MAG: GDYXXLXY domain-containing protein [SAR202 cluster bacterium]|nr:GDYXXLXY domain-containing protein [SAR202 cluster bacterium]